jgi:hypothetical protein
MVARMPRIMVAQAAVISGLIRMSTTRERPMKSEYRVVDGGRIFRAALAFTSDISRVFVVLA